MAITLRNEKVEDQIRAIGKRTGEGPSAVIARLVADAFDRLGRGSGHPAKLSLGECMSYAAAMSSGSALLFKGRDFASTDVVAAA